MPYQQLYSPYNPSFEKGNFVTAFSNSSFVASHIEQKSERQEVPQRQVSESKNSFEVSESKNSPEEEKGNTNRQSCIRRFINVKLAAKLLVLIFLFGQGPPFSSLFFVLIPPFASDGDSTRLFMLCFAAMITYM